MSKILVLGGAGYLGSVLIGKLLKEDNQVTVFDNLMYGQLSLLQYVSHPNFKFVWGDIEDYSDEYKNLIDESDFIFPLFSIVGAPATGREQHKSFLVNEIGIIELIERCKVHKLDTKIIFPTTNSGYGSQSGEVYCTEETPLQPISPYGKQKVSAEKFILNNYENAITLRLATVFGVSSRMRIDLLVNFYVWKAITEGVLAVAEPQQKRNYVHVNDVCNCFIHCIENFETMKGNAFNVGLNENHSKGELAEIVQQFTGCEILETKSYVDPDKRNYIVSNEKINKTGWYAETSIEDAIPELIIACKMIQMLNYGRDINRNA